MADVLDRALTVLIARRDVLVGVPDPVVGDVAEVDAWESVTRSRRPDDPAYDGC